MHSNLTHEFPSQVPGPLLWAQMRKLQKPTSETWGRASPRRATLLRGKGPSKLQGLPPCSLPPTCPPQQVISVKTGRLAVLLIIHEARSAPIGRAGRQRREAAPAPRERDSQAVGGLPGWALGQGWEEPLTSFSHLLCARPALKARHWCSCHLFHWLSFCSSDAAWDLQKLQPV